MKMKTEKMLKDLGLDSLDGIAKLAEFSHIPLVSFAGGLVDMLVDSDLDNALILQHATPEKSKKLFMSMLTDPGIIRELTEEDMMLIRAISR